MQLKVWKRTVSKSEEGPQLLVIVALGFSFDWSRVTIGDYWGSMAFWLDRGRGVGLCKQFDRLKLSRHESHI